MLFVLLLAASAALLWARVSGRLQGRRAAAAAMLLMFVDMATFAPYHDTIKADPDSARFTIKQYNATLIEAPWQIGDQQQLIDRLAELPDAVRLDNAAEALPDNYSAVYRVPFATGYNILDIQQRFELLTQWPNLSPTTRWDLLNAGYILTAPDAADPPEADAKLVLENSQGKLWQRARQPDYARFSTAIRPAQTSITLNGLLSAGHPLDSQPPIAIDRGRIHDTLQSLWPEATDPALRQIGKTGKSSPVDISVLAGGVGKYSALIVDGVTVTPEQRGIVLALIDGQSGALLSARGFDTYRSTEQSDRFAATIAAAPDGTIAALATYDEGTARLNEAARAALSSLGAATDLKDKPGATYALIGVKGATPGSALERFDPSAAVTVDVGVGALPAQANANFSSQIAIYQPNRITLLAQNNLRGLMSISETDFPGWEAYIDGLPTPILRANGMQRAVVLPPALPGRPHEVTFVYRPLSARLGAAISLLALALAFGLLSAVAALQVRRPTLPWRTAPAPV
jgi:hypothetical protein